MKSIFIAVKDGELVTGAKGQAAFTKPSTLRRSIGQKDVIKQENGKSFWARLKKDDYQVVELDLKQILADFKEKGIE